MQQLGNKNGQKVSAQGQVNEPCHRTGQGQCQCQSSLEMIAEVIYFGVVLDKENRADNDWLCLVFEFIVIWCDEVSALWSACK